MDRRLYEAARTGNLNSLSSLTKSNPLILESEAMEAGDNPLHVAILAGQVEFALEILVLKQDFARENNPDGLTPLHIASAKGLVEVVRRLTQTEKELCLLKGREGRIPLHYAAMKGRVESIKELLSACPDSIEVVTHRQETALHLAVKNNHFEAFKELVGWLSRLQKESVLNLKDRQGNTILHLAVGSKQSEVIEFMLSGELIGRSMVDVNTQNASGLTALDVLHSEAVDSEIGDILNGAGAVRATRLVRTESPPLENVSDNPSGGSRNNDWWFEFFKFKKERDSPDSVRNALLVVATLIATATYQAVLQPPGGLWQDSSPPSSGGGNAAPPSSPTDISHQAGKAIMGDLIPVTYILFLFFNSVGFFTSYLIIWYLTIGFPLRAELTMALYALVVTYDISMGALTPRTFINYLFVAFSVLLPILIPVICSLIRKWSASSS